ncbi:copper homeostasis protein CutC [Corynebacterium sp.]|uniref:copper homeostasis protein CutC n=1 Tax=Corynebacterium sp. TaxID=1720 RepID=UPI0028A9E5A9|nr:copper homeostasis protein CutC [Corynebacterium sp.]
MDKDGLSPSPALIDDVVAVDIPVRPMLRLRDGFATDADEIEQLKQLAVQYADAAGVVLGFLTPDSQIDIAVLEDILSVRAKGMDFTFHRAIDYQADGAWETLLALKHPSRHILTAGSPLGVGEGMETLLARAKSTPELILAGSGLKAEFVPR